MISSQPPFPGKQSAVGTSAWFAAATLPGTLPRVHAASKDTLRIALIGCGGRGTGAAVQALSTSGPVTIYALADVFPDNLLRCRSSLEKGAKFSQSPDAGAQAEKMDVPFERQFTGLDAYQKVMALKEVDLVILATPPGYRPLHFEAAVRAGKHVFMEKPVATDPFGVQRVLNAAREARRQGLRVGVGLQRRHDPLYQETVQRIRDGQIGRLLALRAYYDSRGVGKYTARTPEMSELEYQIRNWYYFTWLSGDHIVEQHIHNLDACAWFKGEHPVAAQGQGGREVRTGHDYGQIFDHHAVEYEFTDGTRLYSQCRHIPGCWNHMGEHADGTLGTAEITYKINAAIRLWNQDQPAWRGRNRHNPYQLEHDKLFAAIRNNEDHFEAERGADATLTAILGRTATYTGKHVTREAVLNSGLHLTTDALDLNAPAPLQPLPEGGYPVALPGQTPLA